MKAKVTLFLTSVCIMLTTACSKFENSSEISKEEKAEKINCFLNVTLPDSAEILQYYYKDEIEQNNTETLEAKVRISKSDYSSFINSLDEYYSDYKDFNRDLGPNAIGQANQSWWKYDVADVYDYFEILKTPLNQKITEETKMTAYTYYVVLNSGDNYDILMSYKG